MSQFKNLYDTNNKLNALPLNQQSGSQQQTDYNNALTIYNNYLSSINPIYSTTYTGSPNIVSSSGIYKILQFNSSVNFNIITTAPKRINYVLVGGGASGGSQSSDASYGAIGGNGGGILSGSFIQPANQNVTYYLTIGAGGTPAVNNVTGNAGGATSFYTSPNVSNTLTTGGSATDNLNLSKADGVDQNINTLKYIYVCDQVTETVSSINYRGGGWYNNNVQDLPDGYTLQIGPSYVKRLGGGGGGGSGTVLPATIINNSLWGGGMGGYWVGTISGLAQSGLANTGGGGGGERQYRNLTYQTNNSSGGSGVAIFFFENDFISTPVQNNTQISNAVETISTSQGNYKYGILNNYVFNPINNLGLLNVSLTATIQSLTANNYLSTYIKNRKIQQKLFYTYLPNGSPNRLYINYALNPIYSTAYTATGHNFFFNPFLVGTNSIYYGNLNIINLPSTATNRIYTFNFYSASRYNAQNTVILYPTINVNSVDIALNGYNNVTFPTTNTYVNQKISVISSPTLPLTFFAYTTVQCWNITDIAYLPPFLGVVTVSNITSTGFLLTWVGAVGTVSFTINGSANTPSTTAYTATFSGLSGSSWLLVMTAGAVVSTNTIVPPFVSTTITILGYNQTPNYLQIKWNGGDGVGIYTSQSSSTLTFKLNTVLTTPATVTFDGTNMLASFTGLSNIAYTVVVTSLIGTLATGTISVPTAPSSLSAGGTTYLSLASGIPTWSTRNYFTTSCPITSSFSRMYYEMTCKTPNNPNNGYYNVLHLRADNDYQIDCYIAGDVLTLQYSMPSNVSTSWGNLFYCNRIALVHFNDNVLHTVKVLITTTTITAQVDSGVVQTFGLTPSTIYEGINYNFTEMWCGGYFGNASANTQTNLLITN